MQRVSEVEGGIQDGSKLFILSDLDDDGDISIEKGRSKLRQKGR